MQLALLVVAAVCNSVITADSSEKAKHESPKSFIPINGDSVMVTSSDSSERAKVISVKVSENSECKSQPSRKDDQASFIVTLLNNAENVLRDAKKYASSLKSYPDSSLCEKPMDCSEISRSSKSGVYKVWPRSRISSGAISVYCDMEDDGGAWTIIQKRGDFDSDKEYFYQDWEAYKSGFGNLQKDFWLGNDNIFALTNQQSNMVKFTLSGWEGNSTYATFDDFWIDDEVHKYKLHVKSYRGTAGDSFSMHNGASFTTKDQDNDSHDKNCAAMFKGAWWYTACHSSNLNGAYLKGPHESHADGVNWKSFKGHKYSLKDSVIKIRPKDFKAVNIDIIPQ